ncbi:hypothetical protein BC943DRAFT_335261 [Umbelopsis sp. AD052]|nr:hypothetical protein BC943DRAFT_335261 [Umbelopsis sp. AD052]
MVNQLNKGKKMVFKSLTWVVSGVDDLPGAVQSNVNERPAHEVIEAESSLSGSDHSHTQPEPLVHPPSENYETPSYQSPNIEHVRISYNNVDAKPRRDSKWMLLEKDVSAMFYEFKKRSLQIGGSPSGLSVHSQLEEFLIPEIPRPYNLTSAGILQWADYHIRLLKHLLTDPDDGIKMLRSNEDPKEPKDSWRENWARQPFVMISDDKSLDYPMGYGEVTRKENVDVTKEKIDLMRLAILTKENIDKSKRANCFAFHVKEITSLLVPNLLEELRNIATFSNLK